MIKLILSVTFATVLIGSMALGQTSSTTTSVASGSNGATETTTTTTESTGTVTEFTPGHVLFLAETSNRIGLEEKLKHLEAGPENTLIDVTSAHAGFCLCGPGLKQILAQWTALDLSESALPPASCAETNLAGVHALLVRPPERGRLYIYVAWDVGEHVWKRLVESRAPRGIQAIGMATWLALHEQTN